MFLSFLNYFRKAVVTSSDSVKVLCSGTKLIGEIRDLNYAFGQNIYNIFDKWMIALTTTGDFLNKSAFYGQSIGIIIARSAQKKK